VNDYAETIAELRHQWTLTRGDSGLTFQEFLLINILLHIQAANSLNG
jgi:hypothetical protein